MTELTELMHTLMNLPPDMQHTLIAVSAIALAGFAIYAVLSIAKGKDRR